jgi:hypothetical protein
MLPILVVYIFLWVVLIMVTWNTCPCHSAKNSKPLSEGGIKALVGRMFVGRLDTTEGVWNSLNK